MRELCKIYQAILRFGKQLNFVLLLRLKKIAFLILLLAGMQAISQTIVLSGTVVDEKETPLHNAVIRVDGVKQAAFSDENGQFRIELGANSVYTLRIQYTGRTPYRTDVAVLTEDVNLGIVVLSEKVIGPVQVEFVRTPDFFDGFPPIDVNRIPTSTGNFEDFIKVSALGVSSNNELTSNYNVRGGNYDENIIYVNGVEIYRPFLVRAGQQEGLSFIHSEFVENIFFSAGGFDANYGDVLASVLDVRYREPQKFGGSAQASLMGGQFHLEGLYNGRLGNYVIGSRYRANSYLLNSLPTQGNYNPTFFDVQGITNYYLDYSGPTSYKKLFLLGHFSSNNYLFIPETRTTQWGTVNEAYQLKVYYDGQEENKFSTYTIAGGYEWRINKSLQMNFGTSLFHSIESEHFDVLGEYWINQLETDPSKEEYGDSTSNVGVGGFLDHGRNDLTVWIANAFYDGRYTLNSREKADKNTSTFGEMGWGVKAQYENFHDALSEWHLLDSAGYSIPQGDPETVELKEVIKQNNFVDTYRYTGYYQFTQNFVKRKSVILDLEKTIRTDSSKYKITYRDTLEASPDKISVTFGIRGGHRTYNQESWITPRFSISYSPRVYFITPDTTLIRRNVKFRFASGLYYQPPLYRTMRYLDGTIHPDVVSQKSWHNVLGADIYFKMWDRPFKFMAEAYYKYLWDVVPYEIDNVRIRYYAENNAVAYAYGVDAKINGQFVNGVESFFRIGFLKTMENIENDDYYIYINTDGDTIVPGYTFNTTVADSIHQEPGWIPRPSDQRLTFTLFFQDKMMRYENFKVSTSLNFGTPLPYGPPSYERYKDVLRTKTYLRVDLGFMYDIVNKETQKDKPEKWMQQHFNQFTISLDAFNLLGVNNVVSYQWLQDIAGRYYSVPNNLTGRRINLRIALTF